MDLEKPASAVPRIDVEKVLYSKNRSLKKIIPGFLVSYLKRIVHQDELNTFLEQHAGFLVSYLKRIVHQDELNTFLEQHGHLRNAELIEASLRFLEIKYQVKGTEKIPVPGRYIFVSNHPLGGLDGLVFIYEVSKIFPDLKFPVNDILTSIENLSGIFLPINKHGRQGKEAAQRIEEAYASDCQILYFPAGLCSRKKRGVIKDLQWHKSFISKAIQHKRDIIPAYFSGRNSDFFYNLSNFRKLIGVKANIEMLYLADEMFRQRDKEIRLIFGNKISWQTLDKSKTHGEWAEWVRSKSYELDTIGGGE